MYSARTLKPFVSVDLSLFSKEDIARYRAALNEELWEHGFIKGSDRQEFILYGFDGIHSMSDQTLMDYIKRNHGLSKFADNAGTSVFLREHREHVGIKND